MTAAAPTAPVEQPEFIGIVTSRKSEYVPAAFPGRVLSVDVSQGKRVRKGDPIARLDDKDLKSQIAGFLAEEKAARSQGGASGAEAASLRKQLRAEQRLVALGGAPPMNVVKIRSQIAALGATGAAASGQAGVPRAKREQAERKLALAQLTSPVDGIVMMIKAREGEVVQEGQPIARVFDPTDLIVRFAIPKDQAKKFPPNARVELRVEGAPRPIWARVERQSNEDPSINLVVVEADIDDSKLAPDEITVTATGRVRLAAAAGEN
ncbi:MAG TPA: HlyD family efflux transporter periplasmic adaptor subunit [Kofleriaceae bacterium]